MLILSANELVIYVHIVWLMLFTTLGPQENSPEISEIGSLLSLTFYRMG